MHFYLVRHGQSYVNLPDWEAGRNTDEPLTELGEKQAHAVGAWLAQNIAARYMFASTVARAKQTAEIIASYTKHNIQFDQRLREIGTNAPDGSALPDPNMPNYIEGVWGTLKPYDPVVYGGENWMQFRTRVGSFIEGALQLVENHTPDDSEDIMNQTCIVVCHGGVIEAFYEYVFAKGPWSEVAVLTNNTGLCHFRYQPRPHRPDWTLYFQNRLSHLTEEMIS
jgi:broad specificity phosphatase PhoE